MMIGAMIEASAFYLATVFIFVIAVSLLLDPQYEDSVWGQVALTGLFLAQLAVFVESFRDGGAVEVTPILVMTQVSCAGFLIRHAYRHHERRQRERAERAAQEGGTV